MVKAAARAGKLLMVAHVLPFFPEFAYATGPHRSGGIESIGCISMSPSKTAEVDLVANET